MAKWTGLGIVAVIAALLAFAALRREPAQPASDGNAEISIAALLGASADAEFAAVAYPHEFDYPLDHAQHSDFRTEWWSIAAALEDEAGTALGLQLLLTRVGLRPPDAERESRWAATEIFAGLASISHPLEQGVVTGQRVSRGALGLAGTALDPVQFWVEDWRFEAIDGAAAALSLRGQLRIGALRLALRLENSLPLIDTNTLAGQGSGQRAPFQFYVQPRLKVTGTIDTGHDSVAVVGDATFEHAWGELPLPGGPVERDRMTLYLSDQRVIMIVVTHRADGSGVPEAAGVLVAADGHPEVLDADAVQLEAGASWLSPRTGARYPIEWSLRIPGYDIEARLHAEDEDQEGSEWTAFWAGPISVLDARNAAIGRGFVQLFGYGAR